MSDRLCVANLEAAGSECKKYDIDRINDRISGNPCRRYAQAKGAGLLRPLLMPPRRSGGCFRRRCAGIVLRSTLPAGLASLGHRLLGGLLRFGATRGAGTDVV